MSRFTGEYQSTIDDKGRIKLPANLVRQMTEQGIALHFVLNRGFEKCLMLYPKIVWDQKASEVDRLNVYDPTQRQFIRYFYRGATLVTADTADRILIPKNLLDHANFEKDIILFAYLNQIELWDAKGYSAELANEPDQFSELAARVFGNAGSLTATNVNG
ncbi:MAG: division/cell wall cluster transcriptional repressor MraZ [Saprospiraceae bacterium]|nr:division/cell wall cluster transcriptional repressor MraZ [Saprospiraceae bacterium]